MSFHSATLFSYSSEIRYIISTVSSSVPSELGTSIELPKSWKDSQTRYSFTLFFYKPKQKCQILQFLDAEWLLEAGSKNTQAALSLSLTDRSSLCSSCRNTRIANNKNAQLESSQWDFPNQWVMSWWPSFIYSLWLKCPTKLKADFKACC